MFRMEGNGTCRDTCVKDKEVEKHLRDKKPWNCGRCDEPIQVITRSGEKIDCTGWTKNDPARPPACAEGQTPPTPESCVLKRALQIQRYSPNWVAEEEGVYIEIQVKSTGNIYKFGNVQGSVAPIPDKNIAEFPIGNEQVFLEMKNGESIQMRFVSPRGPGGWNTCKYSPIAFDLDMNGKVEILTGVNFEMDITGDGQLETLHEWFGPQEGILVFLGKKLTNSDLGSSIAISGQQLMGDMGGQYTDGFDKLQDVRKKQQLFDLYPANETYFLCQPVYIYFNFSLSLGPQFDHDNNKIIEGKEMQGFYLWLDVNSNFKLDQGELHELSEYEIIGFSTDHVNYKSKAFKKDGAIMLTEDLWFARR